MTEGETVTLVTVLQFPKGFSTPHKNFYIYNKYRVIFSLLATDFGTVTL